ncbi:permeability factor 2-like [Poeciliopsis prolifica]|uniref:permeability factor 2-like n=1 Tax=Poeciliopsis prolifica TaxID=188132 RepID=UPI0024143630|nr:permeability factor 2-like [Poeciliopsis prolifica]
MTSAVQLIVLLACIFHCMSGNPIITKCHCIKTISTVRRPLIADVKVFEPSPFCNKQEVIAFMNDKSKRCLDPESDFIKNLLQERGLQRTAETLSTKTTTTTSTSTTTSPSATRDRH